jgi:diacylglycerol kinase (ATP)
LPSARSPPTPIRTAFVVNPAAGNWSAGKRWPELERRAAELGLGGESFVSDAPGRAVELTRRALDDGAELLVVVGGDGTVNEAVNGILSAGADCELAVVPCGTGDDLARTFGIPTNAEEALAVAAGGRARRVDAGRAHVASGDGESECYFANFAGAGISGGIAQRGAVTSRRLGARAAYFWATVAVFARWQNVPMTIEFDGETREGRMLEVIVANGAYAAGGMRIAPDASPDDGQFDVVLIGDASKLDFMTTFPRIYRGKHVGHPKVDVLKARTVTVTPETPLPVVLDGEQPGTTPVRLEVLPGALKLRAP